MKKRREEDETANIEAVREENRNKLDYAAATIGLTLEEYIDIFFKDVAGGPKKRRK